MKKVKIVFLSGTEPSKKRKKSPPHRSMPAQRAYLAYYTNVFEKNKTNYPFIVN